VSVIGKLSGKSLEVEIGGEKLTLKPLKFKERSALAKMTAAATNDKQMESIVDFIRKVLQNSYPDTTEEELDNISLEHFESLTKAIMKLHGMEIEGDIKKLASEAQKK